MSMITATAWVPRGFPVEFPQRYELDDEELERVSKLAKLRLDDAKEDFEAAQKGHKTNEDGWEDDEENEDEDDDEDEDEGSGVKLPQSKEDQDDDLREYDLDNYDTDPEDTDDANAATSMFGAGGSVAHHQSNADDPYITLKDDPEADDEEREELQILPTDCMVLAARVEDEMAHLEVYVYEDEEDNLYVHHDIMLPAIPLCLEWLDIPVGSTRNGQPVDQSYKGNFVAVGTFEPDIEIWDLDTVDCMYPNAILGQGAGESADADKKKKKKKRSKKANDNYHVDAVLSLAANRSHRTLLASGSADKTIKLWDLSTQKCAKSYDYHTDKVCSIAWHPTETTGLLSGSYDRTVVAADMRAPDAKKPRWGVESDVEQVRWDPHDPNFFFVTTERGQVHYHDIRKAPADLAKTKSVWSLQAHDAEVSTLDINRHIPGFMATGSTDKEVKLWNIGSNGPSLVVSRNVNVGKVFSANFAPDEAIAFRLAVAGSRGAVQVWDTSTNAGVRRAFADKVGKSEGEVKERVVGIDKGVDDEESDEDDEDDEDDGEDGDESMDDA